MKRLSLALALTALAASTGTVAARPAPAPSHPHAHLLVQRMLSALHRESRIEVTGTTHSKKSGSTQYDVRYQATGLEDYLSTPPGGARAKTGVSSLHYIAIGKTLYSYVQNRWYRITQSAPPDASSLLGLNTNSASCCTSSGIRPGARIAYKGTATVSGVQAFVYTFRGGSQLGGAYGTIAVSRSSFVPLAYTATTVPANVTGTFSFKYGGSFTIRAPKM